MSAALAKTIGHVEIILRNAIHDELTLWRQSLRRAFPGQTRRRVIQDAVEVLHLSRNRLAHHEPMFNRPIADINLTALELAGWICPVSKSWIERHCSLGRVLGRRPA